MNKEKIIEEAEIFLMSLGSLKDEATFIDGVNFALDKVSSQIQIEAHCFNWQKGRPTKPCVFMTRVWDKGLGIYDYNIWRFEKVDCDGEWYLGWLTEDGEEWDDINDCNFDEYCIIESKLLV